MSEQCIDSIIHRATIIFLYSQFYLQVLTKKLDNALAAEIAVNYTSEFQEILEVTTNMECRILTSVLEMEFLCY